MATSERVILTITAELVGPWQTLDRRSGSPEPFAKHSGHHIEEAWRFCYECGVEFTAPGEES